MKSGGRQITAHEAVTPSALLDIPLSKIVPFEGQPRRFFDLKALEELADSIQSIGQQVPVRVFEKPKGSGVYVLIGGERRWRAFGLIKVRTGTEPEVRAIVERETDEATLFQQALVDNLHRSDLVPLDEAASYHRLRYTNKVAVADIAKMIGKSVTYVNNYLWLHQLPEEVKKLMNPALPKDQRLAVSTAIQIARGSVKSATRIKLAKEAVDYQLGTADVRQLIQDMTGVRVSTGVRARKASDDVYALRAFIGRTAKGAARYSKRKEEITSWYQHHRDPERARNIDAQQLRQAIAALEAIAETLKK